MKDNSTEQLSHKPELEIFSIELNDDITLYLSIVSYNNAVQASLYDQTPKLGSMTLGYSIDEQVEQQTLFMGKHSEFADALTMLLVKKTGKLVYASVNVGRDTVINIELIRQLLEQYDPTS